MNETFRTALAPTFDGRLVVILGSAAARLAHLARQCLELGAHRVLVLAWASRGVGPSHFPSDVRVVSPFPLAVSDDGLRILPTSQVLEVLRAFDPRREALVIGSGSMRPCSIDGRAIINVRPKRQERCESKAVSERILSAVTDRRGLARVFAITDPRLHEHCRRVDLGDGVVLSGDSSTGPATGASHVRWVTGAEQTDDAVRQLRSSSPLIRAMPYVRGIPASMHGLVLEDGLLTCPPMQLINLLLTPADDRAARAFFTAGSATLSVADSQVTARMRTIVRAVGEKLADRVGYRGMYCVDGILTQDDFIPTEINAREGSSIGVHFSVTDEVPIQLLNVLAMSRTAVWGSAQALDTALAMSAGSTRVAVTWKTFPSDRSPSGLPGDPTTVAAGDHPWPIGPFTLEVAQLPGAADSLIVHGTARSWGDGKPVTLLKAATAFWNDVDARLRLGIGGVQSPMA